MKKFLGFLALLVSVTLNSLAVEKTSHPNIIFILADDLGFGNVSCYGADKFKTPKIDALAKSGIRFEHCYAAPLCGPSRAEILTGRYAFRTGMTGNDSGPLMKPANEIMIPKILKPAGYVTAHVGKWSQLPLQPSDGGFDEYLRFQGSGQYWREQNAHYMVNGKQTDLPEGKYLPDLMHEFLVDFITRHRDEPFYIHYAMSHVHGKILRTPDSAPDSKDFYADNIAYMDKLVGKLVVELERLKLREKTLIIFVGDNGTAKGEAERSTVNGKHISGHKSEMLEGGSLVPMIASWPGTTPPGKISKNLLDFTDYFSTFAELSGAKLPEGVTLDGHSFAPELRGEKGQPRESIFVELGHKWYVREADWKLNRDGELFDMRGAPFEEKLVASNTT
ncbi:MAG: sulfatase-like hydrolase/transferase, partial [Limisphaerales bacterium]